METIVVNLFGAPGAGKSNGAAHIFSQLKMLGVNAELVTEYAKEKVWENNTEVFKNQAYLFGKQSYRQSRCKDKVDVIVTDSPLPLAAFYNKDETLGEDFEKVVVNVFSSYNNINYFILRNKEYNPAGRHQTEEESDALMMPMLEMLCKHDIKYQTVVGCINGYDVIMDDLIEKLGIKKPEKPKRTVDDIMESNGYDDVIVFRNPSYDTALIGVTADTNQAVYDYEKMIQYLIENDNMEYSEAAEFIDYNTIRACAYTEGSPIVMYGDLYE